MSNSNSNRVSSSDEDALLPLRLERQQTHDNSGGGAGSLSDAYQQQTNRDPAEQSHWDDVCRAYRQYATFAVHQFGVQYPSRLANLSESQRAVLPDHLLVDTSAYLERVKQFQEAAIRNQFCLDCILRHAGQPHSQQLTTQGAVATEEQMSKVSSVLKSLARDWSTQGKMEREMCYRPLIESVQKYLPRNKGRAKLSVPGAGVGRLALELVAKGYTVQGNEFSLFMLLASDFILNGPVKQMKISPWLLETRNLKASTDPLRTVIIPDVDPLGMATQNTAFSYEDDDQASTNNTKAVSGGGASNRNDYPASAPQPSEVSMASEFSMAAGDFVSIYSGESEANCWDAVVACFFLDATSNVVQTLQVVYQMLRPGGYLISYGPLHWHWSGPAMLLSDTTVLSYQKRYKHLDSRYLSSVDFTWEDIEQIMTKMGLELVEINHDVPALYTADPDSMLRTEYRCVHFVARKRPRANEGRG